jgi:uncharacterized protein
VTTLSKRLAEATNALYPRLTERAGAALDATADRGALADVRGHRHMTMVSYKRDGTPVATPLWFGLGDGRLYFRTLTNTAKLKRIARNPRVLVAPSTVRGRPLGPPFAGRARVLESPAEVAEAERRIAANYGVERRLYLKAIRDAEVRYVEVVPLTETPTSESF